MAVDGEWATFDRKFRAYRDGLFERAGLQKDDPWMLERLAERARADGEDERAERILSAARRCWEHLGNEEAAERLADRE